MNSSKQRIEVFFSYSHRDEALRDELAKHLSILKRQGIINGWHDRQITAGSEWAGQIDDHLNAAQVILLLISPDFIASDYCYDIELTQAMQRHEAREACVVPVILRPVDWQGAPFGKLQALPKNAKPITSWENTDEAFMDVAKGIRRAIEAIVQAPSPPLTIAPSVPVVRELSDRQQRRILQELDSLEQQSDLLSEKLKRLREELAINSSATVRFELEKRIEQTEAERDQVDQRIENLESSLPKTP